MHVMGVTLTYCKVFLKASAQDANAKNRVSCVMGRENRWRGSAAGGSMLCSLSRPELYMLCGQQNLISDQPVEPSQISNENLVMTSSRKIVGLKNPRFIAHHNLALATSPLGASPKCCKPSTIASAANPAAW